MGSPAVADEKIFIASWMVPKVYCFNANSGNIIWSYPLNYETMNSPAVADGRLYFVGAFTVYCFNDSNPPNTPNINGPPSGKVGIEYQYSFNALDPDGDDVKYIIDWGDDNSETTGFNPSGDDVKVKHIWNEKGTYTIKTRAEDSYGAISPEATYTVTILKNKVFQKELFYLFFEQFPILQKILLLVR
ncbi:unnamed protein product [marine sediment metagenome]|uniref:PKD domain-containing protein n=1 Tax=marine sediment metagenome TaxID=412755 RepID=X1VJH8_9ZZZZ